MSKKEITLILLFIIAGILFFLGYRYYRYTKVDPQFCTVCHLMEEGFKSWRISVHHGIECQKCHELSVFESNKLLFAFVAKGTQHVQQSHGRENTWKACLSCHTEEASQGSVTLRKSFGHARHVFMQNISCNRCHIYNRHNFEPDTRLCQSCHTDKLVHGMGMAGLNCLNCHVFGDRSPKFVSQKRCFKCHKRLQMSEVMAKVKCFDCHRPHERLRMESRDCLGSCHMNETKVGQHGFHIEKFNLDCIYCHKPHTWRVGQQQARKVCTRCHEYRNPDAFIF